MDPISIPPVNSEPSAPQPAANLNAPELPHAPEKLLPTATNAAQSDLTSPHKTSWGALIGIIIILLVLVIGALYFWGAELAEEERESFIPEEEIEARN